MRGGFRQFVFQKSVFLKHPSVHPCSLFEAGYMPFMHQEIALGISEHSAGYKLGHFAPLMHQDKLRLENQNIN